jgi:regulatory protein
VSVSSGGRAIGSGQSTRARASGTAYDRALAMLAARAYATRELQRRLVQRGWPPEEVEAAIGRLTAVGLLDDAAYARQVTRARVVGGGASPRRVRLELARRGVDRGIADCAINEVLTDEAVDTGAVLEVLARKRAATLSKLAPQVQRRRLYAFLARRGYDTDEIRAVVEIVLNGHDSASGGG